MKLVYEVIEANLSDLMRSPARLESSYEMRDLIIESLSLSKKAEHGVHSSFTRSIKLCTDSSPLLVKLGREECSLMEVMCEWWEMIGKDWGRLRERKSM